MITVKIIRYLSSNEGTLGILIAPGFFCFVLELPNRDNAPNISRIPYGTYSVKVRWSEKYGKHFWVTKVEGRTFILMHPGNYAGDRYKGFLTHSWGCILLGIKHGRMAGQRAIFRSREACYNFMKAMNGKSFELKIYGGA
jgi:hypothetical protein